MHVLQELAYNQPNCASCARDKRNLASAWFRNGCEAAVRGEARRTKYTKKVGERHT